MEKWVFAAYKYMMKRNDVSFLRIKKKEIVFGQIKTPVTY